MKIAFVIYVTKPGRGGHYYSLRTTAEEIMKHKEVVLISIGKEPSPIYKYFGERYIHIHDYGVVQTTNRLAHLTANKKIDLFHVFDPKAFLFTRIVSYKKSLPLVLTRCGGPNPTLYYPFHSDIVLYSKENEVFFKSQKKFNKSKLELIPNRVCEKSLGSDQKRIEELRSRIQESVPVCLRIARIGETYKNSIIQGINLVNELVKKGVEIQFLCVGIIENKKVYESLKKYENENIHFVTEERYHINASELIDIADFVIGTGRGFMEAGLKNKIMLIPTCNLDYPELITTENFNKAFYVNFSQRYKSYKSNEFLLDEAYNQLFVNKYTNDTLFLKFKECFSSEYIYNKHIALYSHAKPAVLKVGDYLLNWLQHKSIKSKMMKVFKIK